MSNKLSNNTFKKKTGIQNIQEYLESGRSITALEALSNFGIFRLASAIEVLRKRGMNIVTDLKEDPNGKTYARYTLVEGEAQQEPEVAAEEATKVEPQRELKVGDGVAVTDALIARHPDYRTFRGRKGVIKALQSIGPWPVKVQFEHRPVMDHFKSFELELLAEAKKELKVGARVRATAAEGSPAVAGTLGTVRALVTDPNRSVEVEVVWDDESYCPMYKRELEVI